MLKYKQRGVTVSVLDSTDKKALKNKVCGRVLAVLFIENKNRSLYSELTNTLENDCLMGQEDYPRYMATTQKLLENYKTMVKASGTTSDGIPFTTDERPSTQKEK